MRQKTVWSRSTRLLAGAGMLGALVGACATSDGSSDGSGPGGADGCGIDTSSGPPSAIALEPGRSAEGTVCPRADRDWYVIDVPAGRDLLDVRAGYPGSLTRVSLFVRVLDADGKTPIADGEVADTTPGDGKSVVETTMHLARPGRYFIEVGDVGDKQSDARNTYVLDVGLAVDPDRHEPNNAPSEAKPADASPGFIAYRGDVDMFTTSLPNATSLLRVVVDNPASARAPLDYQITGPDGSVRAQGSAPPQAAPLDITRAVGAAGDYVVALRYASAAAPDRRPEAGYRLTLSSADEPDAREIPVRNDSAATATCPGGDKGPCAPAFAGTAMTLPAETGFIGSLGDRDVFRIDVTSAAPAVVDAEVVSGGGAVDYALDLLTPHPGSPCTTDAQCAALNVACASDDDCELSHKCLDEGAYAFCKTPPCRLCEGAGACVPGPQAGARVCAATQVSVRDADGGAKTDADGKNRVRTAQPLFTAGPYYLVVHDFQDRHFDPRVPYTLNVQVAPEPDPNDRSADPAQRNNFYNPYPLQTSNLAPSKGRAKDITAQINAGTAVSGWLSYQSDEDWYTFAHPCPGQSCGLVFEWVQPGPSAVRPVFLLRTDDLGLHESWTYVGAVPPTSLPGPRTDLFGDGDCHECSFASQRHTGRYYLQVRDFKAAGWDFRPSGAYQFRLSAKTAGCPASCSEAPSGQCGCFCRAENQCPASPDL